MYPSISSNWNNLSSEGMLIVFGGVLTDYFCLQMDQNILKQIKVEKSDQYQYLGNCPPTHPLTQQQSIDSKLRLMLG